MTLEIKHVCNRCNVNGQIPAGEGTEPCPDCGGDHYYIWGYIEDLEDKLDDIRKKLNDIFEKLNE